MLNELMTELQPVIINAAVVVLTTVASYVGMKIKNIYKEKVDTETKKKVVETTCRYINQLYNDLDGSQKLEKAKENIVDQLNEKGISITELELDVLIESTINSFKDAVTQG
ncbi:hypothetical protein KEC48_03565 [Clostridium sp. C1]|uniref:phage holin, LLH family n=1 Tax=Clostridium sp. C1 TaxID=1155388 RepID=UPI001BAA7404|nr:phage holin, LLH family [Clostridium sp. C1]QUN13616.1 hypothetical protein KEC48_03565 [Clostridium sp. C1]